MKITFQSLQCSKLRVNSEIIIQMQSEEGRQIKEISNGLLHAWENEGPHMMQVKLSHHNSMTILRTLLYQLQMSPEPIEILYLCSSQHRLTQLLQLAQGLGAGVPIGKQLSSEKPSSRLVISTLRKWVGHMLEKDQTTSKRSKMILLECYDVAGECTQVLSDWISESYIRRAYLELYKLQHKIKLKQNYHSIEDQTEQNKHEESNHYQNNLQEIQRLFKEGKEIMTSNQHAKSSLYSMNFIVVENDLICLNIIIYVVGYLQKIQESVYLKREWSEKNSEDFLNDFENKTLLRRKVMKKVMKELKNIEQRYRELSFAYVKEICSFFMRVIQCEQLFNGKKFSVKIQRVEKDPFKAPETNESTFRLRYECKDETLILDLLLNETQSVCILQNMAYPHKFYHYIFNEKLKQLKHGKIKHHHANLYGISIVSTPSKQDLTLKELQIESDNFKEIIRNFGVLLCNITNIVPDGMIVYCMHPGLINRCKREWLEHEKIYYRLNENKKVFMEKETEEQNRKQINLFRKYCDIGSGGIYFLTCNNVALNHENFYGHYSRCIVFLGFPVDKPVRTHRQQHFFIKQLNKCLNHCINSREQKKTIIFLDREYMSLKLSDWFDFMRNEGCITFEGVEEVRKNCQQKIILK